MPPLSKHQKLLWSTIKIVLAAGILAFLFARIQREAGFARLINEPKIWSSLALALGGILIAFSLSFVRWFLLVRGVGLPFHLRDAFRLGTLGFLLNQVSPGSVGGDLLKAVFIAREQPGARTEAVATVFVDRVIGLYAMLLVGSFALMFAGQTIEDESLVHTMQMAVWTTVGLGTIGLAFVLSPLATGAHARAVADRVPLVGHTITRLINAADVYRSRRKYVFAAMGLALLTHGLLITSFWCISGGLPVQQPTFLQNASIVPIGLLAGAVPFTPGGLGALEGSMDLLYEALGAAKGDGTIIAIAYRAMTYVVAAIGACYYFSARKKVDRLLHEAEELAEEIG